MVIRHGLGPIASSIGSQGDFLAETWKVVAEPWAFVDPRVPFSLKSCQMGPATETLKARSKSEKKTRWIRIFFGLSSRHNLPQVPSRAPPVSLRVHRFHGLEGCKPGT